MIFYGLVQCHRYNDYRCSKVKYFFTMTVYKNAHRKLLKAEQDNSFAEQEI